MSLLLIYSFSARNPYSPFGRTGGKEPHQPSRKTGTGFRNYPYSHPTRGV